MRSTPVTGVDAARYALPDEFAARMLTPALVVYLDRVRENLATVLRLTGGPDRWRPHVKTSKIPAVFRELARSGISSFKCATTREAAELLGVLRTERGDGATPDVILAHPMVGPALGRLAAIAREHDGARVSVLCEAPELVDAIPEPLSVFVDVNPGMHRTGVPVADAETILAIAGRAGRRFRGVHFYDGHLHDEDTGRRRAAAFAAYDGLMTLVTRLESSGVAVGEIVTSGTPTFRHALDYAPFGELERTVHRVSPGTVVYHDWRSEEIDPTLGLVPAALVHARVVSHPRAGLATLDAGSKSVAAEAGDPCAFVLGRPDLVAQTPNEEHLPLLARGERPARGERLMLFPRHVCPTVNLAEEAVLVEDGRVAGVVSVSARAHELLVD
jgi:D-serine deaminase-like pyridoxal phosphate-dependent protein